MAQVFISYSSMDSHEYAVALAAALTARGVSVWIADTDVRAGENYAREIPPAIANCQIFLLLVSDAAVQSEHVQRETHLAVTARCLLLPVTLGGHTIAELPEHWRYWLGTAQAVPSTNPSRLAQLVAEILSGHKPDRGSARFTSLRQALKSRATNEELLVACAQGLVDDEIGLIDLRLHLTIELSATGDAQLQYQHLVLNATGETRGGLPQREVWFEHTANLSVSGVAAGDGQPPIRLKIVHDAGHVIKFLPRFATPMMPGSQSSVCYRVSGGHFVEDHYWAQSFPRYTTEYVCELRAEGGLSWLEAARRDTKGDETEVTDSVQLHHDAGSSVGHVKAGFLMPGEVFTVRWGDTE